MKENGRCKGCGNLKEDIKKRFDEELNTLILLGMIWIIPGMQIRILPR